MTARPDAMEENDALRPENRLCFPLYAASREMIKRQRPFLDALGLTYTQYVTMELLWAHRTMSVKALGSRLFLDSGTLTPVLKSLEAKGLISRGRSEEDGRVLLARLTPLGEALRARAAQTPSGCTGLTGEESAQLLALLNRLLKSFR